MRRELYPTIKDYQKMGLSDFQIQELIELENQKHAFREQFKTVRHHSEPNSIFFLDIKNTLYHSGGHGSSGILGRAGDSLQLFMRDILSLCCLLNKSLGQYLTINNYSLCEDGSFRIDYDFPKNIKNAKYKLDIPNLEDFEPFTGRKRYHVGSGPYKTVFISSDPVDVQKNIILFFLVIYRIYFRCIDVYIDKAKWLDSSEILRLEKIFESCNCDLDEFINRLPEYSKAFENNEKEEIQKVLDNTTFLSTKESGMSKAELMRNFLFEYNTKNGLCYEDYNIFACGDNPQQDGPMIKLAFELGGYGCINDGGFNYCSYGESIRADLYKKFNIETRLPLTSYGFFDFYNKTLDRISLDRTWDLAETMEDVNKKQLTLNRFTKTNHYIVIKENKKN